MEDEIKRLWYAEPFVPFAITLTNGERFVVDDPHFFVMQPSTYWLFNPRGGHQIIRINQIASVDVEAEPKAKSQPAA